jgi:FRG domain
MKIEINEVNVNTWTEFKTILSNLLEYTNVNNYIFRGQGNATWTLETSLDRSPMAYRENIISQFIDLKSTEELLIEEFKSGMNLYLNPATDFNLSEIIALMQHHGIPTRALDFTFSPYIASYFAFENIPENSDNVAIWSIHTTSLLDKLNTCLRENNELLKHVKSIDSKKKLYENDDVINRIIFHNEESLVIPLNISSKNKRYNIQQSFMLASGNIKNSFMDNLTALINGHAIHITKYILPKDLKQGVMLDLDRMNINAETLFGGMDGFARRIKQRYENQRFYDIITQEFVERVKKDGGTIEGL